MDSDGPRGPRFGGALDDAARMFCEALDLQLSPETFVQKLGVEIFVAEFGYIKMTDPWDWMGLIYLPTFS